MATLFLIVFISGLAIHIEGETDIASKTYKSLKKISDQRVLELKKK